MAVQYDVTSGALTSGFTISTARTLIEGSAGSSIPPEWIDYHVYNMVASGFTVVEFCTYAATGTGSSYTPKRHGQAVGVATSTWKTAMTVEGSTPVVLWHETYLNPFSIRIQYPLGRELFHAVSTVQGLRVTPSAAPDATHPCGASLTIEE